MHSALTETKNHTSTYLNAEANGHCPVCEHKPATLLYRVNSGEAARHFVNPIADAQRHARLSQHIASLWKQSTCDILRCRDELGKIVVTQPNLRLLEIGAGQGLFAQMISPALIEKHQMLCLEYSNDGIQKIRDYGIDAQALDVRTLNPEQPFDVICCFQVLEHLDRLDGLFTHLRRITTVQGRLFFSVPNPKRTKFGETHGALLDMPPNHIGRWNARAFEAICSRHGWRLDLFESEPQDAAAFSRQFAIYRLMRRQQIGGFIYSKLASSRSRLVRRVLQAPLMALEMSKVALMKAEITDPTLGDSLFVQMSKV